jgi:hypothetical protein
MDWMCSYDTDYCGDAGSGEVFVIVAIIGIVLAACVIANLRDKRRIRSKIAQDAARSETLLERRLRFAKEIEPAYDAGMAELRERRQRGDFKKGEFARAVFQMRKEVQQKFQQRYERERDE